ncbi:hypothetical protein COV22_02605 [Candidatus Woesearchaeota archaeon CG10_big_fil_rev_8_21_14_0_10_47_5]|nr:MAG: hypothetical protein COV22_02605 [Candidatus Woesearchaeota archaeon CG10_big_fil_rev_8_21_14_0_10_47_5]
MPFLDKPFLLLATARGCPYNCTFCSAKPYYGQGLRLFSVSRVVDEMEYDLKGLGVSEFLIWTESFTLNRDFVMAFCDEILRRRLRVHWACNGRVDNADPEMFRRMKRAGCWNIGFGVESASQEVLDKARKGTTVKQIVNAIKLAKAAGLEVTAHCMVGLPGETRQTIQDTVRLLKELDVGFAQFYCAVPFPWTDLYKIAKANNWIRSYDWRYYEQNYSVMGNECLSPDQVVSLRSRAYKSFFLRPKILLKVLKQIRKPRDIVNLAVMAKDFATWA